MSMMEGEATKIIEGHIHFLGENWKPHPDFNVIEALKEAIYALEEIQQYRAIGTVEKLQKNRNFLEFLYNHIPLNEMEQYLAMYNASEEKGE